MKFNKFLGVIGIVATLGLGACSATPYSDVGTVLGAGAGGAGGWFGTSKILDNVGNLNPTQRKIAQGGGAVLGAVAGGFLGRSIGKPWDNQNAIDGNRNAITQNRNMIGQNGQRIDQMGNSYQSGYGQPSNVHIYNGMGGGMNQNCQIRNNYVICNSM